MDRELVSVVTPAYNAEEYVESAIRSVHRQSWRPMESVVVDDASTDATSEVVARLATELDAPDFRVRLIRHEENRKAAGALRTGFSSAEGVWVSWLSADDEFVEPSKTERQAAAMRSANADVSYYRSLSTGPTPDSSVRIDSRFFSRLGPLNHFIERSGDTRLLTLMFKNAINGSSSMMRRSRMLAFDDALGVPDEDSDMWMRSSALGLRFLALPGAPVFYRDHPEQTSKSRDRMVFGGSVTRLRMLRYLSDSDRLAPLLDANVLLLDALPLSAAITWWPAVTQWLCDFATDSDDVSRSVRRAMARVSAKLDESGVRGREISPQLDEAVDAASKSEVFGAFIAKMERKD